MDLCLKKAKNCPIEVKKLANKKIDEQIKIGSGKQKNILTSKYTNCNFKIWVKTQI